MGYSFNNASLLDQACTHSSDRSELSYRQLAFLWDAVLWAVFAQHAHSEFGEKEDPVSGAWAEHMSRLTSRANFAATARLMGLQHHLRHSTASGDDATSSSSSSSSSSRHGMHGRMWSSDALAELSEGLVGAVLLDSDYATVKSLLQPWVAAAFAGARSAAAAPPAPAVVTPAATAAAAGVSPKQAALGSSSCDTDLQQHVARLLQQQLRDVCGVAFRDAALASSCGRHIAELVVCGGSSSPGEAERWRFPGHSLLRLAAARHIYSQFADADGQQQQADTWLGALDEPSAMPGSNSSSSSSSSSSDAGSSGRSGSNVVQLMSQRMVALTSVRHRCKMWLWLGLDPAPWCPEEGSAVLLLSWNRQKRLLSSCLDVLVAAVFLDGGMAAAGKVLEAVLSGTPPTTMCKAWIPSWALRHGEGLSQGLPGQRQQLRQLRQQDAKAGDKVERGGSCRGRVQF